mgnify:CR=1 FL=1
MPSVKCLKKSAYQLQSGSSYESGSMLLMPFTAEGMNQGFDHIEDESILGYAFKDTPAQGNRHVGGAFSMQLDAVSIEPLLEAAMGTHAAGVFSCDGTTNAKKLSVCTLDSVAAYQYANVYVKSLSIKGSAGGKWSVECDLVGVTAESRQAVGSFPGSVTNPNQFMIFTNCGGTGYFRVGNHADALASGDNLEIDDFELNMECGFDEQFANSQTTLTPTFAMTAPGFDGSFRIARHEDNTFLDFRDNDTALQAELYIYLNATNTIKIEIPNFKIDNNLTDEEIIQQGVDMMIGRNGLGTSYTNSNMAFVSPVRITVVNS